MFRIVTYNIRAGLGMDGVRSIRRIAQVLADLSPDIVCMQEVDAHSIRSWLANQPKFVATRLGMESFFQRNISQGLGGFGNCILSKSPIIHCISHRLPGEGEPRGMMEVQTTIDGHEITVLCTHLSTEESVRVDQAAKVSEIAKGISSPKLLCGDMNDVMSSRTLSSLLADPVLRDSALEIEDAGISSAATYENTRIDFVLADLRFDVAGYRVVDCNASDHRPVVVDLAFSEFYENSHQMI